ncbi:uncharacterized protein LOC113352500 [Papaver somniferum]|uniref:uncharacterized protein LOC113352500 n=1 Tax=Papaver somniferum TaxID=3469 RepID=UPI000E6F69AF|nr:uncharacterized protein LOC113352500 [Papaver somniferum]
MNPFQALYGYAPPHLAIPYEFTTSMEIVEEYLKNREAMVDILKESLHKAQERSKKFVDKKMTDKNFDVGDQVYLNIQPYRQPSLAVRRNFKLSTRYYGPFCIVSKIGTVAYKPDLLAYSKIHPMFYVS